MTTATTSRCPTRQVALVTGANRGLGLAVARRLGSAGITVLIGARDTERGEAAARELRSDGLDVRALQLDVTDATSVAAAAACVTAEHGRLDTLVNNAGILPEATSDDVDVPLDLDLFRRTFDTNVLGVVAVTQAFAPLLRRTAGSRIVNVSSTMGSLADQLDPTSPYAGLIVPAYQTSKAALNALTVVLSKALAADGVRVNAVCPGWVQTDFGGDANRAAAPTTAFEAARVVSDLALQPAGGPTGTFTDRDGPVAW